LAIAATPNGIEVGNADGDQNGRDECPGIAEPHQSFQERAECPGKQDGLHADVLGALRDEPAPELVEGARHHQRVEQHHAPERDPVDVPDAGGGAVEIRRNAVTEGHPPYPQPQKEGDDRTDQRGKPSRHAKPGKQDQQGHDRDQRDDPGCEEVSCGIKNLIEHGRTSIGVPERRLDSSPASSDNPD
jgi:hypothetical protein